MLFLLIAYVEQHFISVLLFFAVLDFILIGGILPLIERKFLSLVQRRVGPYYIGYKGRLQFLSDALKVLMKDFVYHGKLNSAIYLLLPFLYFYINCMLLFFFHFGVNIEFLSIDNYFMYMYLIFIFSNVAVFLSGLLSKNKFSLISGERAAIFVFSLDLIFTMLLSILIIYSESFGLKSLKGLKISYIPVQIIFLPLLPVVLLTFLMDANKAPYDLFEAESELVMGYTTEYSGFLFGLYILTEYLHVLFFAFLIVVIYF